MRATRLTASPIIRPGMDARMGGNINGPSLIRVPDWIAAPLGRYYLYFGHHAGDYIRLAYADAIEGPWTVYTPGVLPLAQAHVVGHLASPHVQVDHERREIRMYYHGPVPPEERAADACVEALTACWAGQRTKVAVSPDGLNFTARPAPLAGPYLRVFAWNGKTYAVAMPGLAYVSPDGGDSFEHGPMLFTRHQRHAAALVRGDVLYLFFSNVFDCPERILCSRIQLAEQLGQWRESEPFTVLAPETDYEGGNLPLEPSQRGAIHQPARQLRDPAIFEQDGRVYLLYAVAGESGIAVAELSGLDE